MNHQGSNKKEPQNDVAGSSRRDFLRTSVIGAVGIIGFPTILSSRVLGDVAPSKRIQVAQIGCGRMGTGDMGSIMDQKISRVLAVCDLDSRRLGNAKAAVEKHYGKDESKVEVKTYHDYHDVLSRPDIDAVVVSVPDHWHALVATEAVLAGKHVYVQKPVTYNISEAIALRRAVAARKSIVQVGSQQRCEFSFRRATELVRDGHIGKLHTIRIGLGVDKPSGKAPLIQPVPANLDYERWLGPAPEQGYIEGRVHPQDGIGRPGWITTEDFGLGMITNWGAHHIDIAQWGMGMELSGPNTIDSHAEFMTNDQWTVHTSYHIEMMYGNGVKVILDNKTPVGVRFEGENGWIFCTRGAVKVTASDPNVGVGQKSALLASDPKILEGKISAGGKLWPAADKGHYANWLESVAAGHQPIAPVEQAARSLTTCAAAWIGMKLKRKLTWDPVKECFVNDDEANALCSRKPRKAEYDLNAILKKAGV